MNDPGLGRIASLAIFLGVCGCDPREPPQTDGAATAARNPEIIAPRPARALPESEARALDALRRQLRAGEDVAAAARGYVALLQRLEIAWGPTSADLAPHYHDAIVLQRRVGLLKEAQVLLERGRRQWPEQLQLRALEATIRAELADRTKRFDSAAAEMFSALLEPDNLPRLRGHRINYARLHTQWSRLLLIGRRFDDALRAAERGLTLATGDGHLLETNDLLEAKALVLDGLQRSREARPLLEDLVANDGRKHLRPLLAKSRLQTGDAKGAWSLYRELLSAAKNSTAAAQPQPGIQDTELDRALRRGAATALIELERPGEACSLLLDVLAFEPDHVESLLALSRAQHLLERTHEASALRRRARALEAIASHDALAKKAQLGGYRAVVLLHRARALIARERVGAAFAVLEQAVTTAPGLVEAHLELSRTAERLGRYDTAQRYLRNGRAAIGSSLTLVESARLHASNGNASKARQLLQEASHRDVTSPSKPDATINGFPLAATLRARRLQVFLILGDVEAARALVSDSSSENGTQSSELLLARAELALHDDELELAERQVSRRLEHSPGVDTWPDAVRLTIRLRSGEPLENFSERPSEPDWSALMEHPHLLALAGDSETVARLGRLSTSIRAVVSEMRGRRDVDMIDLWRRVLVLYRDAACHRKAREVAYYLVTLRPLDVELQRELVSLFGAPEDLVRRYAALVRLVRLEGESTEGSEATTRLATLRARLGAADGVAGHGAE